MILGRRREACLIAVLIMVFLVVSPSIVRAPETRTYVPNSISVTYGTATGDINDVASMDGLYYNVVEEDIGADDTDTVTESWLVQGTLDSGIFPDDMETIDNTGCVYLEEDDGLGAQDRWMLLLPTGGGTYNNWLPSGAGLNWQMVNDDPPHDGDATYVFTTGNAIVDTYATEDISVIPVGYDLDGNLIVFAWGKTVNAIGSGQGLSNRVRTYVTDYDGPMELFAVQNVYQNISNEWLVNPNTGNDWTLAEINAMEIGIVSTNPVPLTTRVTSVDAVVPLRQQNFVLDVRLNVTGVPAGRENYLLTIRALTDPGEDVTTYVYDHVGLGWIATEIFTTNSYVTDTFVLDEALHVNAGEVWIMIEDFAGDNVVADGFDIDYIGVRAWDVSYTYDFTFNWLGLEGTKTPILTILGYKSDAESITVGVWRTADWYVLNNDIFIQDVPTSYAYNLASADVDGSTLQVRFRDNTPTDNVASTVYLDFISLEVEIDTQSPASPIDVYLDIEYELWSNEIIIKVWWTQAGGPEQGVEVGKQAQISIDGKHWKTFAINGTKRVSAPWDWFDGSDHNISGVGSATIHWSWLDAENTYYSDEEIIIISNFPRWAVVMFGLFILMCLVLVVVVKIVRDRRED